MVTLDIEMPKMNGLDCLKQIMSQKPLPVIIVSYLTLKGAEITMKAFELGALDFVTKPAPHEANVDAFEPIKQELIQKIKIAAEIDLLKLKHTTIETVPSQEKKLIAVPQKTKFDLVAIGASTGGPKALFSLLTKFPKTFQWE